MICRNRNTGTAPGGSTLLMSAGRERIIHQGSFFPAGWQETADDHYETNLKESACV